MNFIVLVTEGYLQ